MNRGKNKKMVNVSVSNDYDLKQSYSILKLQMEDDGKVSISTNRRLIRTFSGKIIKSSQQQQQQQQQQQSFINSAQYFFHPPFKIPTPLHQITLKKSIKSIIVKIPDKTIPKKQTATSELIRKKILNAQRKSSILTKYIPTKISIEPKISYQKLFQSSNQSNYHPNHNKSQHNPNHNNSITFDSHYI
ncbi:unnamed protein product (macronuclear) [Paramecium tetraurelia]|uniref:Chromosome undetermined scaffold_30, whole genome shotgun sequence n=1 Tax=Paramecium tetraurelia TaxID=5888 RepID=A0CY13_PARTE|nr:uncharacterized protein GSPATT00011312001 [Paramecium tetraurelia]XP_001443081.1 uncharacterized protein GSPATT00011316001 [Paramecium tetraurelia]CAK75680.1 unnamed protein product [Paramecium tetraurelia]CAK75684.1 unnamed protein product [Paramecium tetraurelia]|eukprot:XP_001443077.1 hypothetical protein (macronuclear) [Paramecium tetraurelia strain d4-2]